MKISSNGWSDAQRRPSCNHQKVYSRPKQPNGGRDSGYKQTQDLDTDKLKMFCHLTACSQRAMSGQAQEQALVIKSRRGSACRHKALSPSLNKLEGPSPVCIYARSALMHCTSLLTRSWSGPRRRGAALGPRARGARREALFSASARLGQPWTAERGGSSWT